jgi:hypothetical protein
MARLAGTLVSLSAGLGRSRTVDQWISNGIGALPYEGHGMDQDQSGEQ